MPNGTRIQQRPVNNAAIFSLLCAGVNKGASVWHKGQGAAKPKSAISCKARSFLSWRTSGRYKHTHFVASASGLQIVLFLHAPIRNRARTMAEALRIRVGQITDVETITNNNICMAKETEGLDLPPETARAGAQAVLEGAAAAKYYVGELGEQIVAQLMITLEWSDW